MCQRVWEALFDSEDVIHNFANRGVSFNRSLESIPQVVPKHLLSKLPLFRITDACVLQMRQAWPGAGQAGAGGRGCERLSLGLSSTRSQGH